MERKYSKGCCVDGSEFRVNFWRNMYDHYPKGMPILHSILIYHMLYLKK